MDRSRPTAAAPAAVRSGRTSALGGLLAVLRGWWPLAVLLPVCAVPFVHTLRLFFVNDDYTELGGVVREPFLRFFWDSFILRDTVPFWRPLESILYEVNWQLFGLNATGWRAWTLGMHLLNVMLLYWLVARVSGSRVAGFLAAGLFGTSAAYGISGHSISSSQDVLGVTWTLAAVLALTWYTTDQPSAHRGRPYAATIAAYIIAMLCWESATALGVVIAAVVFLRETPWRPQADRRGAAWRIALPLTLAAASAIFNDIAQVQRTGMHLFYGLNRDIPRHFWWFLGRIALPLPDNGGRVVYLLRGVGAAVLLGSLLLTLWRGCLWARAFALWALVAIAPFTLWKTITLDRWVYYACVPVFALAGWGAWAAWRRLRSDAFGIAARAAAVAGVALAITLSATRIGPDNHVLFTEARRWEPLVRGLQAYQGRVPPDAHVYLVNGIWTHPFDDVDLASVAWVVFGPRAELRNATLQAYRDAAARDPLAVGLGWTGSGFVELPRP